MTLDTIVFFEIALAGFITVRTFRYFSENREKYSEFEWIGLSAFAGLCVIMIVEVILQPLPGATPQLDKLFANPFATATFDSIVGILTGYSMSRIVRTNIWKRIMEFLGKDGKQDKSEAISIHSRKK